MNHEEEMCPNCVTPWKCNGPHIPKFGTNVPKSGALPTDSKERKALPIATGVLDYFPLALAAVAHCSKVGNDQHNPGKPMGWDRTKSGDESDALIRHFMERGTVDSDGVRHSAKVAWRALSLLQKEIEAEREREDNVGNGKAR